MHIRESLTELRRLRLKAQYHSAKAAEYMARATHGTSTRRATDMSGTGDCPLTTSAEAYGREHAAAIAFTNAANAIWAQVLQVEQVGLTDNFFELGGHSLLATQVMVRLREVLGIEAALKDLFEYPELGEFVRSLEEKNLGIDPLQAQLAKSLEALKRLTTEELDELIS